jgi:hypothetical protein
MRTGNRKVNSLTIASALLALAAAILACNMSSSKSSNAIDCFKGITPGQTKRADVLSLLGQPASTEPYGNAEMLIYASAFPKQFNTVIVQNNMVVFMDVLVDSDAGLAYSAVKTRYGQPGLVTYSTYQQGSNTYIFPDHGRAFIADESLDAVFTKQCFLPMSLDDYMKTWGKDLPSEDPFTQ